MTVEARSDSRRTTWSRNAAAAVITARQQFDVDRQQRLIPGAVTSVLTHNT